MILSHIAPIVNPTPADVQFADRLAWANDAPENDPLDGYPGPGWQEVDTSVENSDEVGPTEEEDAHETGRTIGIEGGNPQFQAVNDHFDRYPGIDVERAFYRGLLAGRQEHARRAGHALGLAGQACERPGAIHRRFRLEFETGWQLGADARTERERIEAEWAAEYEADLRDIERLEHNREASGWLHTGHAV